MKPQHSLAIIEAKVSVKTMATMEPKDDLGYEEPGALVVLMSLMEHGEIEGVADAKGDRAPIPLESMLTIEFQ
jgi:hypothetical protein